MKRFNKKNVLKAGNFKLYRKKHLTQVLRIDEPFEVETTEGILKCKNGFLAIDSRGFPYPIDYHEFYNIYELAE